MVIALSVDEMVDGSREQTDNAALRYSSWRRMVCAQCHTNGRERALRKKSAREMLLRAKPTTTRIIFLVTAGS